MRYNGLGLCVLRLFFLTLHLFLREMSGCLMNVLSYVKFQGAILSVVLQ